MFFEVLKSTVFEMPSITVCMDSISACCTFTMSRPRIHSISQCEQSPHLRRHKFLNTKSGCFCVLTLFVTSISGTTLCL